MVKDLSRLYGLKVYVPPNSKVEIVTPTDNGIRSQGLEEMLRS